MGKCKIEIQKYIAILHITFQNEFYYPYASINKKMLINRTEYKPMICSNYDLSLEEKERKKKHHECHDHELLSL